MKLQIAALTLLVSTGLVLADPAIENVQRALKDQGFYYGEITGQKDADTTAAIRRYQIRNGLQITGDLNDETIKSLGSDSSSSQAVAKPAPTAAPQVTRETNTPEPQAEARDNSGPTNPLTGQPFPDQTQDRQSPVRPNYNSGPAQPGQHFEGTPYESAPPEEQQNVIVSAQNILAQRGLYRGPIDGMAGPELEFSLRAYQARVRIPVTGKLDLETLAALQLLPHGRGPIYVPRRRPQREEPVRGEWIPER